MTIRPVRLLVWHPVPCPHTLQPLSIELEGVDAFILRDDITRRLPHTDPRDRQITIGLGCF